MHTSAAAWLPLRASHVDKSKLRLHLHDMSECARTFSRAREVLDNRPILLFSCAQKQGEGSPLLLLRTFVEAPNAHFVHLGEFRQKDDEEDDDVDAKVPDVVIEKVAAHKETARRKTILAQGERGEVCHHALSIAGAGH